MACCATPRHRSHRSPATVVFCCCSQTRFGGAPGRGYGQGRPPSPELGTGEGVRARHVPGDVPSGTQDQAVAEGDAVLARPGARVTGLRHR